MMLEKQVKRWVYMKDGHNQIILVTPDDTSGDPIRIFELCLAYHNGERAVCGQYPEDYLGRILFDADGNWIYDGEALKVEEQEQIGDYIANYQPHETV
jgi:hypothetical protein